MRLVVPALSLLVPLLGLSGCADSVYYQTRYAPTSGEQAFGVGERWFWSEDDEVYELPANPPALAAGEEGDEHRSRVDCRKPGQAFRANVVARGDGTEIHGHGEASRLTVARMDDSLPLAKGPGPETPYTVAGWHDEARYGTRERTGVAPVAAYDDRPRSTPGSGLDRSSVNTLVVSGDDSGWCPPAH